MSAISELVNGGCVPSSHPVAGRLQRAQSSPKPWNRHSVHRLAALGRDVIETPPVAVKRRLLAGQQLPALHDHVNVFRIELDTVANTFVQLRRRERCAATKERIVNQFPATKMIQDWAPHQFDGLLRGMIPLFSHP